MYNEVVINTQGDTMFQDLKKTFKKVQEDLVHLPLNKKVVVLESVWKEFEQEFNICFVEPEDDEENQLWVEGNDIL
jgi:hypothetical protein